MVASCDRPAKAAATHEFEGILDEGGGGPCGIGRRRSRGKHPIARDLRDPGIRDAVTYRLPQSGRTLLRHLVVLIPLLTSRAGGNGDSETDKINAAVLWRCR